MPVILTIHGGRQALADVMEGLVERNARSIRTGAVPPIDNLPSKIRASAVPVWRDAVSALLDGSASRGTLVCWDAATRRARGQPATVGFVGDVPDVVYTDGRVAGLAVGALGRGVSDSYAPSEGSVTERMMLTLDDNCAQPVRDVNTAIARHNAKMIRKHKLPRLYESGVRYETEGSPELWWDAMEILRNGHDDCEGLAAYRAGELMVDSRDYPGEQGRPVNARVHTRFIERPDGASRLFHAVTEVLSDDGDILGYDDPSPRLGMPVPDWYLGFAKQLRRQGKPLG
jgi:hypothetical protein